MKHKEIFIMFEKNTNLIQYGYIILFGMIAIVIGIFLNSKMHTPQMTNTDDTPPHFLGEWFVVEDVDEPIYPIPLTVKLDQKKVALGDRLFHDKQLSKDNTISCASCHDLTKGGTDQVKFSTGIKGAEGGINSPTVYNSGFNFVQFWDGRAKDLEEQVIGPVHNPVEMGTNWQEVIPRLQQDSTYVAAFNVCYENGIDSLNIQDAIAIFERSLITPNAPFDHYLRGDQDALTSKEKEGYSLFKTYGCISCHQGINIGGNMYQRMGVMNNYFAHRPITNEDRGRYNVTKDERNMYQFKVPSLRNIEVTYPYLHDGSAETLQDIIFIMTKDQLGRPLNDEQIGLIIQFLKTLTGEYNSVPLPEYTHHPPK